MSVATKKKAQLKHPYIEKKEGVCGGEPVIIGTRISVSPKTGEVLKPRLQP